MNLNELQIEYNRWLKSNLPKYWVNDDQIDKSAWSLMALIGEENEAWSPSDAHYAWLAAFCSRWAEAEDKEVNPPQQILFRLKSVNISTEIWNEAQRRGLDWTATGGGCDFIHRIIGGIELVLTDTEAETPRSLDDKSCVGIYQDDPHWSGTNVLNFDSAKEAMAFMAHFKKECNHTARKASGTAYDCVADRLSLIRQRPEEERDMIEEAALVRCLEWLHA